MGYETVKSVSKALAILELLTADDLVSGSLGLGEIASATGLPSATARNLLRTLEECGYATRVGHGRYEEGERCSRLFRGAGLHRRLREIARPIVERCAADLGESVLLATIVSGRRYELLRCQAGDDRLVDPQWHANALLFQMRTTRCMLAWMAAAQLDAFIEQNGLPSETDWPACRESRRGLDRALAAIREAGGCNDLHGGYVAIAVPVLAATGESLASLGCYAPNARTDKARAAGIQALLHDCAATIQQDVGR